MIEAGSTLTIPIIFCPREVTEYVQRVQFVINDFSRAYVDIRGRGVPLRLEPEKIEMQNVEFGVTTGSEPVSRSVRLVNRSARAVSFELTDGNGELSERAVSWSPSTLTTLRPREGIDVDLRFAPVFR